MLIAKRSDNAAFRDWMQRAENRDTQYELINGKMVEIMPSFEQSSGISARFAILLGIHLLKHPIAHITDAQGGYDIDDDNNYAPDVGIILKSRLPELPVDSLRERYLKAGVKLLWYAYPQRKEVEVHRPDQPVEVIDINGVLDASPVLPNCLINVADVFA
jgi:Uma2 family endonuclease